MPIRRQHDRSFRGAPPRRRQSGGVSSAEARRTLQAVAVPLSGLVGVDLTAPDAVTTVGCGSYGCAFRVKGRQHGTRAAIKITTDPREAAALYYLTFVVRSPAPVGLVRAAYVLDLGMRWGGEGRDRKTGAYAIVREWLEDLGQYADDEEADDTVLAALRTMSGVSKRTAVGARVPYVDMTAARRYRQEAIGTPWQDLFSLARWFKSFGVTYYDWKPNNCGVRLHARGDDFDFAVHDLGMSYGIPTRTEIPALLEVRANPAAPFDDPDVLDDALACVPRIEDVA